MDTPLRIVQKFRIPVEDSWPLFTDCWVKFGRICLPFRCQTGQYFTKNMSSQHEICWNLFFWEIKAWQVARADDEKIRWNTHDWISPLTGGMERKSYYVTASICFAQKYIWWIYRLRNISYAFICLLGDMVTLELENILRSCTQAANNRCICNTHSWELCHFLTLQSIHGGRNHTSWKQNFCWPPRSQMITV